MAVKFRKPMARKQGLKILAYGKNNTGKSVFTLTFPGNAIVDSESKIGVYENDPEFKDNIVGIADTANYFDALDLANEVIKHPDVYHTFTVDSYTNVYNAMQVSAMENEENRARKKGRSVDDATISMRGWGKVKLNNLRLNELLAQASASGVTFIGVAHEKDIYEGEGENRRKVGVAPELDKNVGHLFDVIIHFYKAKDLVNGGTKFEAEIEKDTTRTYDIGTKFDKITYDNFKEYIERSAGNKTIETNYDKDIHNNISTMAKESEDHDTIVNEFKELYKELAKNAEKKKSIVALIKEHHVEKYNDPAVTSRLAKVIEEMKKMK